MPAKNRIKQYIDQGYYHLYNSGANNQPIFRDHQDYSIFLTFLNQYLSPKDLGLIVAMEDKEQAARILRLNNFAGSIDLIAYCLMPNHFHLLVKQRHSRAIESLMRSFLTRYAQYFNHRHNFRNGGLFADTYKAVIIRSPEQLLHLTRFIHRNPQMAGVSLVDSPQPSSLKNYLGLATDNWVKPQEVLTHFSEYGQDFYADFVTRDTNQELLQGITID